MGRALDLSVAQVREAQQSAPHTVSLETPIGGDGDHPLGDTLTDHAAHSPSDVAIAVDMRERIEVVLQTLTPREGEILRRRFGMAEGDEQTLEEVGQIFGVTRERIRQVEARALHTLRSPACRRELRPLLED